MQTHPVVSLEEWMTPRSATSGESESHAACGQNHAQRLALPWVKVEKTYLFDTPNGKRALADLFGSRSQLIVYHFMLGPGWTAGCPGCSFLSDHFDGAMPHLEHHDVTMIAVSRAPLAEIEAYKSRMGWRFPWVSASGNDFNYDYRVSFTKDDVSNGSVSYNYTDMPVKADSGDTEMPGLSAFYKDEAGTVFHTYSTYARGLEEFVGTLMILDRAPKGRNEKTTMDFVRRHQDAEPHACCAESTAHA